MTVSPIKSGDTVKVSLVYRWEDKPIAGIDIKLYMISVGDVNNGFTACSGFEKISADEKTVSSYESAKIITEDVINTVKANKISPINEKHTGEDGTVCFDGLTPGIYMAVSEEKDSKSDISFGSSLFILDKRGKEVTIYAKGEETGKTYKVRKIWAGEADKSQRPQYIDIEVEIGENKVKIIRLSEKNDWEYSWSADYGNYRIKVKEKNVPNGYVSSVKREDRNYTVTNTYIGKLIGKNPQTGSEKTVLPVFIIGMISAAVMTAAYKRKRNNDRQRY